MDNSNVGETFVLNRTSTWGLTLRQSNREPFTTKRNRGCPNIRLKRTIGVMRVAWVWSEVRCFIEVSPKLIKGQKSLLFSFVQYFSFVSEINCFPFPIPLKVTTPYRTKGPYFHSPLQPWTEIYVGVFWSCVYGCVRSIDVFEQFCHFSWCLFWDVIQTIQEVQTL